MAGVSGERRRGWIVGGVVVGIVVIAAIVTALLWPREDAGDEAAPTPQPSAPTEEPAPEPTPEPTEDALPANTEQYDLADLEAAEVFSLLPDLPIDDDPFGETAGLTARAASDRIPVFADPAGEPVATLAAEQRFGGTKVAVIEEHENWVQVLLSGRQGLPGEGDPAQITGWLRADDVVLEENPYRIDVFLGEGAIDIVEVLPDGTEEAERLGGPFAWGTEATPTPLGRSFVMLNETTSIEYARRYPMVYLSVQSPTLAGFDGQAQATTAFHYHDVHSGAISNGCIRLGGDDMTRVAEVPDGTPVYVHE